MIIVSSLDFGVKSFVAVKSSEFSTLLRSERTFIFLKNIHPPSLSLSLYVFT